MRKSRRATLVAIGSTLALAGCTEDESDSNDGTATDSDGDGVPDESDYAPGDPDVQSENDLKGTTEAAEGGQETSESADDFDTDDQTADEVFETDTATAVEPELSYPSHSGSHTITAADNYWAWEFTVPESAVLSYTVENLRDENYDFDVLLYDQASFREYRAIAMEREDGARPTYLNGSAPGTESMARQVVQLTAGTYYLVVDNTDLSDAGDWGTEDTRRVYVDAETSEL